MVRLSKRRKIERFSLGAGDVVGLFTFRVCWIGYPFKAEVLLLDLRQPGEFTDDLFAVTQPVASGRLMSALDEINDRYGRGMCGPGASPAPPIGGCVGR